MFIDNYFNTTIWSEQKPEFVKSLNKASNKYIKDARTREKKFIKEHGDFGRSYHSTPLTMDNDFLDFRNYIGQKSWEYLDHQGYDMQQYTTMFSEMWVQEFAKKGGGHHSAHVHWNQHVSGFYFLKCSDKTSYPVFHEPRTGARATKLKMKDQKGVWGGSELIHFKPTPGTLIIFPGFLEHEFSVDFGLYIGIYKPCRKKWLKMFKKKKYTVIRQAISKDLAAFVANYFMMQKQVYDTCRAQRYISPFENIIGHYEGRDEQIPETYSQYSNIAMETLMLKCQPKMEEVTGLKLYPAYTYARIYKKGDILKRHKDRFSCEISTTMNLGGDDWPIYLEPSGKEGMKGIKVDLKPGDMLVYSGCELEHWRNKFRGKECVQVFLHYNNRKTPGARDNMFDKRPHLGLPSWFKR